MASIPGGTRTCETSKEKFLMPSLRAPVNCHGGCRRGRLESDGEKDDLLTGLARAMSRASRGEYTSRRSAHGLRGKQFVSQPGTLAMSPKDVKMTSGREEISIALSIIPMGVTHTGNQVHGLKSRSAGEVDRCQI